MWLFSRQGRDWHVGHLWLAVSNHFVKLSYTVRYSKHYQEYFVLQMWSQNLNLSVANSWSKRKWYITEWPSMEFSSFIYNWVYYCKLLLHTSYQILSRRKSALRLMELDWSLPDEDTALLVTQGWNTSFSVVLRLRARRCLAGELLVIWTWEENTFPPQSTLRQLTLLLPHIFREEHLWKTTWRYML